MFTLNIYSIYGEPSYYEYLTKEECYDFLNRNYSKYMEDPDSPYSFEIVDQFGNILPL